MTVITAYLLGLATLPAAASTCSLVGSFLFAIIRSFR